MHSGGLPHGPRLTQEQRHSFPLSEPPYSSQIRKQFKATRGYNRNQSNRSQTPVSLLDDSSQTKEVKILNLLKHGVKKGSLFTESIFNLEENERHQNTNLIMSLSCLKLFTGYPLTSGESSNSLECHPKASRTWANLFLQLVSQPSSSPCQGCSTTGNSSRTR